MRRPKHLKSITFRFVVGNKTYGAGLGFSGGQFSPTDREAIKESLSYFHKQVENSVLKVMTGKTDVEFLVAEKKKQFKELGK